MASSSGGISKGRFKEYQVSMSPLIETWVVGGAPEQNRSGMRRDRTTSDASPSQQNFEKTGHGKRRSVRWSQALAGSLQAPS